MLIQDADLEYAPSDYGKMLAPILNNQADMSSALCFKQTQREEQSGAYFFNTLANRLLTFLFNFRDCDFPTSPPVKRI
ncbi:MAG: hypothetical protein ACK412_05690 [Chloroherpetonaceae bacterium]